MIGSSSLQRSISELDVPWAGPALQCLLRGFGKQALFLSEPEVPCLALCESGWSPWPGPLQLMWSSASLVWQHTCCRFQASSLPSSRSLSRLHDWVVHWSSAVGEQVCCRNHYDRTGEYAGGSPPSARSSIDISGTACRPRVQHRFCSSWSRQGIRPAAMQRQHASVAPTSQQRSERTTDIPS